jgi:dUTP pyrophosphatase
MSVILAHPDAKIPARATELSAGFDLSSVESLVLGPGERKCISTGLRVSCPAGTYGRIAPRSGLAVKHGIDVMAGVIDADYKGIVGVVLVNLGRFPIEIGVGDRIAQLIFERYESDRQVLHAIFDDAEPDGAGRGTGGFGSTGI